LDLFKTIDSILKVRFKIGAKKVILGCKNIWSSRRGYYDFRALSNLLEDDYQIVMICLNAKEIKELPNNILGEAMSAGLPDVAFDCITEPSDLIEH